MQAFLYVGNDNLLQVTGLQNEVDGSYLNAATVTAHLRDMDGADVAGDTWPITLSHVSESPDQGKYQATLKDTLAISHKTRYQLTVSADGGAGLKGEWTLIVKALRRYA